MKQIMIRKLLLISMALSLILHCAIPAAAAQLATPTDNEIIINNYNAAIQMTNEEACRYFDAFLTSKAHTLSINEYYTVNALNEFIEYSVSEGIIKDTPEQRSELTKAVLRGEFMIVVAAGRALGLTTAAMLLENSLQDDPSDFIYGVSSTYANQISKSVECTEIIELFEEQVAGVVLNKYVLPESTILNSTPDLHLAYNKVDYIATGYKSAGNWRVYIAFSDIYNYDYQDWLNEMTDNLAITIINNYAAFAQEMGAIVPFNVNITVLEYID